MANSAIVGLLRVLLAANTAEFDAAMKRSANEAKAWSRDLKAVGEQAQRVGEALTRTLTLPIVALGATSVKAFATFDAAMTRSTAILGNLSEEMRAKMEGAARDVGKSTAFSASQAAEAYYFLASAGYDAAQAIGALPKVAQFAQAGDFNLAQATEYLTDAQSALGLTIRNDVVKNMENMSRVSDVLVKAAVMSNASVQQFAESLTNKAGAALRLVNKDVEEGVAVLSVYADQGVKSEEAGEKLNIVLRDLQTAAIKNRDAFEGLGIQVFDAQGELRNIADIVGDLERALGGMSDEQRRATLMMLGFQDRSVSAVTALLGTSAAIRTYESTLRAAGGVTEEIAQKQLQSFSAQMKLLWSRIQDVGIQLGKALVPAIQLGAQALGAVLPVLEVVVKAFTALPAPLQLVVVGLVGIVAAAGPAIWVFGQLASSASALVGAFTAKGIATRLLAGAFGTAGGAATGAAGAFGLVGRALGLLTNPIGLTVAGVGLLAYGIYKVVTAQSELETSLHANAAAFRQKTDRMAAALDTYRELAEKQSRTKEETDRLAAATKTLAESSGLSSAAFTREAGASDTLVTSLVAQVRARKELLAAATNQKLSEVAEAEDRLAAAQQELERVLNNQARVRTTADPSVPGASAFREMTSDERIQAIERLSGVIQELQGKVSAARDAYAQMAGVAATSNIELPGAKDSATIVATLTDKLDQLNERTSQADQEITALSGTARARLVEAIKAGVYSMDDLKAATGLSEMALQRFKAQLEVSGKAAAQAEGPLRRFVKSAADLESQLQAAQREGVPMTVILEEFGRELEQTARRAQIMGQQLGSATAAAVAALREAKLDEYLKQVFENARRANQEYLEGVAEQTRKHLDALNADAQANLVARDQATAAALELYMRRTLTATDFEIWQAERARDAKIAALEPWRSGYEEALGAIETEFQETMATLRQRHDQELAAMAAAADSWGKRFQSVIASIPQLLQSAFTGGGGLAGAGKAILTKLGESLLGKGIGDLLEKLGGKLSGSLFKLFGSGVTEAIGKILPGIGDAIGALAGPLLAKLAGIFSRPAHEDVMRRVGYRYGVAISEELARAIADQAKSLFGGDRATAELFNLGKIIDAAGGVDASSTDQWSRALRDVFSAVETGAFTSKQALQVLNDVFPRLAAAVESAGGIASAQFQELIDLAHRFGLESQAVTDFLNKQATTIGTGLAAQLEPLTKKYEGLGEKIKDARKEIEELQKKGSRREIEEAQARLNKLLAEQAAGAGKSAEAFDRVGLSVLASYNAGIARGMDQLTLMQQLGPALDQLIALQQDLGLQSDNAALKELINLRAKMEANQALVTAASTWGQTYAAMINLGVRDTDALMAMQQQGVANYNALIKAGFSETQALAQIKGGLQAILKAHEELGIPIDENTQKLIDQAREAGILGEEQKDAATRTAEALERVAAALERAFGEAGNLGGALGRIPRDIPIQIHWEPDDLPVVPGGEPPPSFASGTEGYQYFGAGTLAMLHGWEKVTPLGQDEGEEGASRQVSIDARTNVTIEVQALDADDFATKVERDIGPTLADAIERGHRGLRTRYRMALLGTT